VDSVKRKSLRIRRKSLCNASRIGSSFPWSPEERVQPTDICGNRKSLRKSWLNMCISSNLNPFSMQFPCTKNKMKYASRDRAERERKGTVLFNEIYQQSFRKSEEYHFRVFCWKCTRLKRETRFRVATLLLEKKMVCLPFLMDKQRKFSNTYERKRDL